MIPLLAILGLVALAASSRARAAAPSQPRPSSSTPTSKDLAARIVQETKDIIDGKRDAYTDDDEAAAELERARRAVQLAQQKEGQTPPASSSSSSSPRPKPASTMTVGPVQQRQAAAPAARPVGPPGTDLALAKKTAPDVAAHLKGKKLGTYSREVVKLWQTRAGLKADGIYGRGTEAALKYFGAKPPRAFFAQGTASYTPPA